MSEQQADDQVTRVPPKGKRGGQWVTIGEESYRIPPLGFMQIQEFSDDVKSLDQIEGSRPSNEQMHTIFRIVHAAMSRNYPDLKVEEVADMIDLGNYTQILIVVLAIAGFEKRSVAPKGETAASTGTASTPL